MENIVFLRNLEPDIPVRLDMFLCFLPGICCAVGSFRGDCYYFFWGTTSQKGCRFARKLSPSRRGRSGHSWPELTFGGGRGTQLNSWEFSWIPVDEPRFGQSETKAMRRDAWASGVSSDGLSRTVVSFHTIDGIQLNPREFSWHPRSWNSAEFQGIQLNSLDWEGKTRRLQSNLLCVQELCGQIYYNNWTIQAQT